MAGLHQLNGDRNGKFLVVRRDGSVPAWPHFVLGARDPAARAALMAYADRAAELGMDPQYVTDIRTLAAKFDSFRSNAGDGNPDAPLHRRDHPDVLKAMETCELHFLPVHPADKIQKPKSTFKFSEPNTGAKKADVRVKANRVKRKGAGKKRRK